MFAPITQMEIIQVLISQAAQFEWLIHQMNVKLTFLDGVLKHEVYVEQPSGYTQYGKQHKVLMLKKSLYMS
jgi:Reverse transcriptase (RNA-dependent DNA polymerase)